MLASDCHECRGIRLWNMAKILFPIAVCCRLIINVAVGKSVAVFGIFMDFTPVAGVSAERLIEPR